MRGNSFGKLLSITSYGESHGVSLGVVIDGMPSNLQVDPGQLQRWLERRRPGKLDVSSSRKETDQVHITSGIFEGRTLGTPIHVEVFNQDQKSSDYEHLKSSFRAGHADRTTLDKFKVRDHRGGGRASGRETLARVIGGYFASLVLPKLKIESAITQLAHFETNTFERNLGPLGFGDPAKETEIREYLLKCKSQGESCGGTIKLRVKNVPGSLGEPVFDKLKADIGKGVLSVGSCIGISFGAGRELSRMLGTEISKERSYFGGIEGGISNGLELNLEAYFKAPSTVGESAKNGRHDPCILPRVRIVIESMLYLVLADHYLRQRAYET